jgi:predicted AAA+ superfamily ATPase
MDPLFDFQESLLRFVSNDFRRYLHSQISWDQRMIGIKGPRGAGKTTLMLQYLKYDLEDRDSALYVTADHTWFYSHTLFDTASDWHNMGGRVLIIDEVHKYPKWSVELKNIYDGFPGIQVVFSASSALDIYRGEADLSRRVISYSLAGMSFREYLNLVKGFSFQSFSFKDIQSDHLEISRMITAMLHPLPHLKRYLKYGYLPIIAEGEETYLSKLGQIINTILDTDLSYIEMYNSGTASKVKKLLAVIAESAPFKPNISSIARKLDLSRDSVYLYISQLYKARLINNLYTSSRGISSLQKPDKIFLENTNLAYALSTVPNIGNIRETFLLNQLINSGLEVNAPQEGDFQIGEHFIEVGGKNKSAKQVSHLNDYLLAVDDIETGSKNRIPLWLFGFLY